ncbi:MAG: PQQ-dependent sugar dehydrogenase [Ignavibacteriae bacterium]|nr:MAG: PQQ-dependent sugar dehydrogenase [Ignavibacteriota bacterium]
MTIKQKHMLNLNFFFIIYLFINIIACSGDKKEVTKQPDIKKDSDGKYSIKVEPFVERLYVPWSIVFTGPDRMLVNERNGHMRVIQNGTLRHAPILTLTDVSTGSEEGLMGLAVDPDYLSNKFIYISYAYETDGDLYVKIERYRDDGNTVSKDITLFDKLPAAQNHAGCRLRFGPDKKLYITIGDATDREFAQDMKMLHGKLLRVNPDGSVPSDNPFPNSPIWTLGHRNSQGIDWYPGTEILYSTEHGPSGFDGPGGGDEVNIIVKGKNYGWPEVHHRAHKEGMVDPVLEFTPAEAPASGMFYHSNVIPEFTNNFFFGCLRGEGIIRVIIDPNDPTKVLSFEKMPEIDFGRIREITEGPDGAIYFSTSNRDGRGDAKSGDDKIYRITNSK